MRKILASLIAAVFAVGMTVPAFASPIPYVTVPLDSVNASVNTAVASINSSLAPAATLQTVSGANGCLLYTSDAADE